MQRNHYVDEEWQAWKAVSMHKAYEREMRRLDRVQNRRTKRTQKRRDNRVAFATERIAY